MERAALARILRNLVVFKNLIDRPVFSALTQLLELDAAEGKRAYAPVCDLARGLYPEGADLTDCLLRLVRADDNFYIDALAKGLEVSEEAETQAHTELDALSQAAAFSSDYFAKLFKLPAPYPGWRARRIDFALEYREFTWHAHERGYGIFAAHSVFSLAEDGSLAPVNNPDTQRLDELFGYENERRAVIKNTEALLAGLPANNVLLYGDAGTGKSSTVKAIANEYAGRGLRLIQAEKALLRHIPALLDSLAGNPLKFIIFIDDLSFETGGRDFTALKTVLEGSVAARAKNTAVYATSNRRHLLRESMDARRGDEVHLGDTLEETASLAARFGIVVTFTRPDRDEYIELTRHFARLYELNIPDAELISGAEAYAIRSGGRSPRVAKQYAEYLIDISTL